MVASVDAPILPWGRPGADEQSGRQTEAASQHSDGYSPPLSVNQRIEVRWQLTDEESGETSIKWWGAEVIRPGSSEAPLWTIRYDAESGFDAEEAEVQFTSPGRLSSDGDNLLWRVEGCECEAVEAPDEVVLQELAAEQEVMERELGQTVEEAALQHIGTLAPDQQRRVVTGFRTFADHFTSQLRELVQQREGADYVITESDVHQMLQGLKQ